MTVMGVHLKLTVGEITVPMYIMDAQGVKRPGQPILVLRETTFEEYVACVDEHRGYPMPAGERQDARLSIPYFYEISMD